jgi:hypothetical protein
MKLLEVLSVDYPETEILVSFPNDWLYVVSFPHHETTYYVARRPESHERTKGDHFAGLPRELNLSLGIYKQYQMFQPWPTPLFAAEWDPGKQEGRLLGQVKDQVRFQPVGWSQVWQSPTEAVLWECYVSTWVQQRPGWQEQLATFWQAVERDIAVQRIYTHPHDPAFQQGYTEFLGQLGYGPHPEYAEWWGKTIEQA